MDIDARRAELKSFLRARRAMISPESMNLERGIRRMTPGLRREELAAAAGVGLTWYTWLEQGRAINPSPETLRRVARALSLNPSEETYLFALAGVGQPAPANRPFELTPSLSSVLSAYRAPATILDPMFDVLAYNDAADRLYGFDACVDPHPRNQLWQLFMNPVRRRLYVDHEVDTRNFVELFRANGASLVAQDRYRRLLTDLTEASREFASLWAEHRTTSLTSQTVRMRHAVAGDMCVRSARFPVEGTNGAMLVLLGADDKQTERAFDVLSAGWAEDDLASRADRADASTRHR